MDENFRENALTDESEVSDFMDLILSCEGEDAQEVLEAED